MNLEIQQTLTLLNAKVTWTWHGPDVGVEAVLSYTCSRCAGYPDHCDTCKQQGRLEEKHTPENLRNRIGAANYDAMCKQIKEALAQ